MTIISYYATGRMMVIRKIYPRGVAIYDDPCHIQHATPALSGVPSSISNFAAANATLDLEEVHYLSYNEQRVRSGIHSVSMINLAMENDEMRDGAEKVSSTHSSN